MRVAAPRPSSLAPRAALQPTALSLLCLGVTLIAYLVLAYLYATRVPIWNAPDEPAHYNYIRHVATTSTFPVLQPGDYDVAQTERLMSLRFPVSEPIDWMRYESHQPPLYYVIAAPVFQLTARWPLEQQVLALRLFSTALGAALIVACYFLMRQVAPNSPAIQRFVPAFVAFLPMHIAMTAAINNDTLAELLLVLTLTLLVGGLRFGVSRRRAGALGVLLGLIVLTKTVAYAAIPIVVLGLYAAAQLHAPPSRSVFSRWIERLSLTGAVAAAVGGWWLVRNAVVYGGLDIFGLQQHDRVVVGQPLTGAIDGAVVWHFASTTFRSFWGQFGWMAAPLSDRYYFMLTVACTLATLGLLRYAWRVIWGDALTAPWRRWATMLLVMTLAFVVGQMVYYNLTYLQPQGRYLFPALAPLATLFGVGWRDFWRLPGRRGVVVDRNSGLMLGLWIIGLAGLAVLALVRVIIPYFAQ